MAQRYSIGDCYKILSVTADCSWEELRKIYRLQIKKWHPDRFKENTPSKIAAEEKIKAINVAFQQLSDYFHKGT